MTVRPFAVAGFLVAIGLGAPAHAAVRAGMFPLADPIGTAAGDVGALLGVAPSEGPLPAGADAFCQGRCDEVRGFFGEVADVRVGFRDGRVVAAEWIFGDGVDLTRSPMFMTLVGSESLPAFVIRRESAPVSGDSPDLRWTDFSSRELAWPARRHLWVADVVCPVVRLRSGEKTLERPAAPIEWRVRRLRVGPAAVAKDAAIPDLVGVTGSDARMKLRARRGTDPNDPLPLGPTALDTSDLAEETVSLQEIGGVVSHVMYSWTGDRSGHNPYASPVVVGELPKHVFVTSTSGDITAERERVYVWTSKQVRNKARVYCPLVTVWDVARHAEVARPARENEYRIESLEQWRAPGKLADAAVDDESPIPIEELLESGEGISISPIATAQPHPAYPPWARKLRLTGTIVLKIVVSEEGVVTEINVLRDCPLFRANAIAAVSKWKYKPVVVGGRPIVWTSRVNLNFKYR